MKVGDAPSAPLAVHTTNGVCWLRLNRPAAGNAISLAMAEALDAAIVDCDEDEHVRCVVLTGEGRMFCGGGDITEFDEAADVPAHMRNITSALHSAVYRLLRLRKPVITGVNGPAAGAGLGLAMLGDLVIGARSSSYTAGYCRLGLTPDGGTSWLLPRIIGLRKASELFLTNRTVRADEAAEMGLISQVVEDSEFAVTLAAAANKAVRTAVEAVAATRELLLGAFSNSVSDHLAREANAIAEASGRAEAAEGIGAFVQKRAPLFTRG